MPTSCCKIILVCEACRKLLAAEGYHEGLFRPIAMYAKNLTSTPFPSWDHATARYRCYQVQRFSLIGLRCSQGDVGPVIRRRSTTRASWHEMTVQGLCAPHVLVLHGWHFLMDLVLISCDKGYEGHTWSRKRARCHAKRKPDRQIPKMALFMDSR